MLWVRDGDTWDSSGGGTAGRTSRPPANATLASASIWLDIGAIVELDKIGGVESKEVLAPAPGLLQPYDSVPILGRIGFDFTALEMSKILFETIFHTPKITSSNFTYNPNTAPSKKGWFQLQQYKHDNTLFNTLFHYGELKVAGDVTFGGEDHVKVKCSFRGLYSTLNTGTVA